MASYAWIITQDHLATESGDDEAGTVGPSGTSDKIEAILKSGKSSRFTFHTFRMYDDDGILYYTGRALWNGDQSDPHEAALVGPLADFGAPNAGAVLIKWHGKPEWTCEY